MKKVTIVNGSPNNHSPALNQLLTDLLIEQHNTELSVFNLAEMNIKQCTGCWSCWWKTPGLCVIKDDAELVMRSVVQADLLVFASPIVAGFTSSLLKKMQDRLVALIHPYIEPRMGECHHRKRYDNYPDFALLLDKEYNTDAEDIDIITIIYKRLAINFHCQLKHTWFANTHTSKEIANELSHI